MNEEGEEGVRVRCGDVWMEKLGLGIEKGGGTFVGGL